MSLEKQRRRLKNICAKCGTTSSIVTSEYYRVYGLTVKQTKWYISKNHKNILCYKCRSIEHKEKNVCVVCGKNKSSGVTTFNGITYEKWYAGPTCNGCYNREYSKKRIVFQGKRIYLKENPRKGICEFCNINPVSDIHHEKYDMNNPLKHTFRLCKPCHMKRNREIKYWSSSHG